MAKNEDGLFEVYADAMTHGDPESTMILLIGAGPHEEQVWYEIPNSHPKFKSLSKAKRGAKIPRPE